MKRIHILAVLLLFSKGITAQNWYPITTGTTKQLNTIDFPSTSVGYIGGNDSLLLKSIDGGQTWQQIPYTGVTFTSGGDDILDVDFVSETTGFMSVSFQGVYKTTDGGSTWTSLDVPENMCYTRSLYFTDAQNGFIGGAGCFQGELISKMTAGDFASVTTPATFQTDRQVSGFAFRNNLGLASSHGGCVLRSVNGGSSWDTIPVPANPDDTVHFNSVLILNNNVCLAAYSTTGSGFGVMVSLDAGLTWSVEGDWMTFYYPDMMDMCLAGNGKVYSVGKWGNPNSGLIFTSSGASLMNMESLDHPLRTCAATADSVVFAAGENGYLVTNVPTATLGLQEVSGKAALTLFPNPASDRLHITGLAQANERYRITTVSGNLVQTGKLKNGELGIGALQAGVYLLQLEDQGITQVFRLVKE